MRIPWPKWAQIFTDTADSDSYGLWLLQDTGGLNLFGAIHQAGAAEPHVQGGAIPLNAWSHVAMTFDAAGGQMVAYVNGREDSFLPRPFNGLIDEVSILSRALSAAEVQGIFKAGSAGKCK